MSVSLVTIEGHVDVESEPPPGSMSVFEGLVATEVMPIRPALPPSSMVTSGPEPLPRVMSGSMTLQQPGSDWIAMGPFITKGYVDTCAYVYVLGSCCCRWHTDLVGLGCP